MKICKKFTIETGHRMHNCATGKCRSMHGHSVEVEVKLSAKLLDNGFMVTDFGNLDIIKDIVGMFDHTFVFWNADKSRFKTMVKDFSPRWISLPVQPSAESLTVILAELIRNSISKTAFGNGGDPELTFESLRYHETKTGYAEIDSEELEYFATSDPFNLSEMRVFSQSLEYQYALPTGGNRIVLSDEIMKSLMTDTYTQLFLGQVIFKNEPEQLRECHED